MKGGGLMTAIRDYGQKMRGKLKQVEGGINQRQGGLKGMKGGLQKLQGKLDETLADMKIRSNRRRRRAI